MYIVKESTKITPLIKNKFKKFIEKFRFNKKKSYRFGK